jgi:hypothetical protein
MNDAEKLSRISDIILAWVNADESTTARPDDYLDAIMEALRGETINGVAIGKRADA